MASYTPLPTRTWHDNAEPYLNATNLNEIESELQTLDERTRDLKATKLEAGDVSAERLAHLEQLVDTKVNKSGDTMTGDLVMDNTTEILHRYGYGANEGHHIKFDAYDMKVNATGDGANIKVEADGDFEVYAEHTAQLTTGSGTASLENYEGTAKVEVVSDVYTGTETQVNIKAQSVNIEGAADGADYAGDVKITADNAIEIGSANGVDISSSDGSVSVSSAEGNANIESENGKTLIKGKSIEAYTHDTDSDHISSLKADYKGFDVEVDDGDYNRKMSFRDGKLTVKSDTDDDGSIVMRNDGWEGIIESPEGELSLISEDGTGDINLKGGDAYLIRGDAAALKIATESYVDGVASGKMGKVRVTLYDDGMSDDLLVLIKAAMASPKYDGLATVIATNNAGHRPSWFTGWVSCVVMGTTSEKKVIAYDTLSNSRVAMASVLPNDTDIDWVEVITSDSTDKWTSLGSINLGTTQTLNFTTPSKFSELFIRIFSTTAYYLNWTTTLPHTGEYYPLSSWGQKVRLGDDSSHFEISLTSNKLVVDGAVGVNINILNDSGTTVELFYR